jgi:hypothetical protein
MKVGICLGLMGIALQGALCFGAVEAIDGGAGGYCLIYRNGSPDVSQPDDYTFDSHTGEIYLKTVGSWELTYQSTAIPNDPNAEPVDVCRIREDIDDLNGDFHVRAAGLNLSKWIYFVNVSVTGAKVLELNLSGSVTTDGLVSASDFTLTNSVIAGDVGEGGNGTAINVGTVVNDATTGIGLNIGGSITEYVYIQDDLVGTINIGQDISKKLADCLRRRPVWVGHQRDGRTQRRPQHRRRSGRHAQRRELARLRRHGQEGLHRRGHRRGGGAEHPGRLRSLAEGGRREYRH